MADYEIVFARSARKELEDLDDRLAIRVLNRIEKLSDEPRPDSVRKLRGSTNLWRLRIGDYRVLYAVDDDRRLVDIVAVRHRSDAYR
jgi:mRNA interferase RelE/StbE